ncbi:MAG: DUF1549 domain-containing protein [Gemmataceae bacterium]|nr:DUF1549 domain-containing protein [Gemmataceae bacterium]
MISKSLTKIAFSLVCASWVVFPALPQEKLLSPGRPMEKAIDHYISQGWKEKKIQPAQPASAETWLRRITLDLEGRISTPEEVQAFINDPSADKKMKVIENLMKSPAYLRHQTREFENLLMNGSRGALQTYLTKALGENRPWDRIFKELMVADESVEQTKGSSEYLKARIKDLDRLTTDVSVAFFGVNVSCAQCHNHPLVHDWTQDHFYGMKSFFSRTFEAGNYLGEREFGVVKFLPNKGKEKQAEFMFLTGKKVTPPGMTEPSKEEQKKEKELLEKLKKDKTPPPPAKVSTRAMLVDIALGANDRGFFSKAIVNNLWHRFYGHGLVMPLDQMHSENPSSHPELLEWLARDFAAHGYDLNRLVKGLVASEAYGLSSRFVGESSPLAKDFAVARLRPLTPMQMAVSLRLAGQQIPLKETAKRVEEADRGARGLADQFQQPGDDFQIGVTEALFLANSPRFISECLPEGADKLVTAMAKLPSSQEQAARAVLSVLSRTASDNEKAVIASYLTQHASNPLEGCKQVVWSLMTSPEFRFNH